MDIYYSIIFIISILFVIHFYRKFDTDRGKGWFMMNYVMISAFIVAPFVLWALFKLDVSIFREYRFFDSSMVLCASMAIFLSYSALDEYMLKNENSKLQDEISKYRYIFLFLSFIFIMAYILHFYAKVDSVVEKYLPVFAILSISIMATLFYKTHDLLSRTISSNYSKGIRRAWNY